MIGTSNLQRLEKSGRKGSKARCHWLTRGSRQQVANRLTELLEPHGTVSTNNHWMPAGFADTEEARLDRASKLIPNKANRDKLRDWWLAVPRGANTPNWDIASTCSIDGKDGLLLVEAKAHTRELDGEIKGKGLKDNASANSRRNHGRIGRSIQEANISLSDQTGVCWALSLEHRYQMSNRFAWSWKLAELGYSVVLVYLGFLNADEMKGESKGTECFLNHAHWSRLVKEHGNPLFATGIWECRLRVDGQYLVPRIVSREMAYDAPLQ